jgi:hypothetical protein
MMTHPDRPRRPEPVAPAASNPLERLAQLLLSNDRLIADLTASRSRIVSALAYLDQPDCNLRFGSAHLERCRARHSGILAELRANRVEALHLLGSPSQPND